MDDRIRKIVIVGGGTAGWITAGTLAAKYQGLPQEQSLEVVLVESPNVPTVGVGEGTWPTLRGTLKNMGIRETDFIRECDATFKQGARFAKWVTGAEDDAYYHPLVLPQGFFEGNLANDWLRSARQDSFTDAVCPQGKVCDLSLGPKAITTPEYVGELNYAYHLNAGKFSAFIQKHVVENLGVNHIYADMSEVNKDEYGYVVSIDTKQAGIIDGDLFVDCTGFRSLLLGEALDTEFHDCSDVLFIDNALAVQCPYSSDDQEIASQTISTAQSAGWIWDIGLSTRRGIGHVYSSRHTDKQSAEDELAHYIDGLGANLDELEVRHIPIRSGHRSQFWKKNVVGIGLSAGFLEPLEASAIVLVEMSAQMLAEQMPVNRDAMQVIERRFNDVFHYRWQRIIDFLKLHYCISKREDNAFWVDNRDPDTIPDSLLELLELWKYQAPWQSDFVQRDEVFPSASYQYVLYGMEYETLSTFHGQTQKDDLFYGQQHKINQARTDKLTQYLPSHRSLINKIHQYGLQTV